MKPLMQEPLNLIITGVGGQGNVLISQILGHALLQKGYQVAVGETFGLSQRGGSVQSHIRVSTKKTYGPLIPEGRAQVILGLEPLETLRILPEYGREDVQVVVNSRHIPPLNVSAGEVRYPSDRELKEAFDSLAAKVWWVNGTSEAQKLGAAIMANIVLLGVLTATGLIPLTAEDLEETMGRILPAAKLRKNITALGRGMKLIQ
jgi:indolepyruvate ferredoxin oxidoreductase beta subunit